MVFIFSCLLFMLVFVLFASLSFFLLFPLFPLFFASCFLFLLHSFLYLFITFCFCRRVTAPPPPSPQLQLSHRSAVFLLYIVELLMRAKRKLQIRALQFLSTPVKKYFDCLDSDFAVVPICEYHSAAIVPSAAT